MVETVSMGEQHEDGSWTERDVCRELCIRFEPKAEGGFVGFDLITGSPRHECFRRGPGGGGGGSGDRAPRAPAPQPSDATSAARDEPRD
jgi:hypothetical protein